MGDLQNQLKLRKRRKMQLKGPLASVSRKDLNASVRALLPKLKEKGLEPSIEYLKHNIKYSKYIPYTKYKSGLCAHVAIACGFIGRHVVLPAFAFHKACRSQVPRATEDAGQLTHAT